jgi:Holliday junction resolvase RusA-like endonuclease
MIQIAYKPMSVNKAWQGKRFKTPEYKKYERDLLLMLPSIHIPTPPYSVSYEFGVSSKLADWDNPIKPFQDILQKRYGFDDRDIFRADITKVIVGKGKEYLKFNIQSL